MKNLFCRNRFLRPTLLAAFFLIAPFTLGAQTAKPAGSILVGLRYVDARLGASPLEEVRLQQGILTAKQGDKKLSFDQLSGALFTGLDNQGNAVKLRIQSVLADPNDPELLYYSLEYWREPLSDWQNLCLPDAKGEKKAVLVEGVWDEKGGWHASEDFFSMGCTSSAIAKCMRWGYKPWKSIRGRSLKPFHQACMRMVRADYLGDGHTGTKDGTPIFYNDVMGINYGTPTEGMALEAAWGVDGAVWIARPRFPEEARGLKCEEGRGCAPEKAPTGAVSQEVLLINYSKK